MRTLPDDATKAYLFLNADELLNAITPDSSGSNLPLLRGSWEFEKELVLGIQEPLEANVDPEPVLRGIRSQGYFIWRANNIEPFGTGQ